MRRRSERKEPDVSAAVLALSVPARSTGVSPEEPQCSTTTV
ncbi:MULTISPECIES: hypothetical protein [unclassified Nonomuraea]